MGHGGGGHILYTVKSNFINIKTRKKVKPSCIKNIQQIANLRSECKIGLIRDEKADYNIPHRSTKCCPQRLILCYVGTLLFRIARAGIFPRSSLLGAGQVGFWEFGEGGSVG
jgi:hypothetical protein